MRTIMPKLHKPACPENDTRDLNQKIAFCRTKVQPSLQLDPFNFDGESLFVVDEVRTDHVGHGVTEATKASILVRSSLDNVFNTPDTCFHLRPCRYVCRMNKYFRWLEIGSGNLFLNPKDHLNTRDELAMFTVRCSFSNVGSPCRWR